MLKRCKVCKKKLGFEQRIDSEGNLFCSEDCFENFEGGPDDFNHPYIDDYESIRRSYSEWMINYKEDLHKSVYCGFPKKTDLIEWIDEILEPFWDYYRLEGSDGIFSAEIYKYMQELLNLQKVICNWKLDERKYKEWLREMRAKKD